MRSSNRRKISVKLNHKEIISLGFFKLRTFCFCFDCVWILPFKKKQIFRENATFSFWRDFFRQITLLQTEPFVFVLKNRVNKNTVKGFFVKMLSHLTLNGIGKKLNSKLVFLALKVKVFQEELKFNFCHSHHSNPIFHSTSKVRDFFASSETSLF